MELLDPQGHAMLDLDVTGREENFGPTELFTESSDPPLEEFFALMKFYKRHVAVLGALRVSFEGRAHKRHQERRETSLTMRESPVPFMTVTKAEVNLPRASSDSYSGTHDVHGESSKESGGSYSATYGSRAVGAPPGGR
jgi:hypothetical protein